MRPEEHGRKAGYVMDRNHSDARVMLGEFSRLNGETHDDEPISIREVKAGERDESAGEDSDVTHGDESVSETSGETAAKPRRRRGRRGGRGRHKPPAAAAS
jgi:hypothetical protein